MMKRREFLEAGLATSAGLVLAHTLQGADAPPKPSSDAINLAVIGVGEQGRTLTQVALGIPNIRFRAICDIWEYRRQAARRYLETYNHTVNEYGDYHRMLDKEKDLHAVIVATPDFVHAEQANACLKAGLHVYCEAMMANSIDDARSMVRTTRQTGKLLQIGYQRRSNPRYQHAYRPLLKTAELPGQLTHVSAQWAHRVKEDLGWPKKFAVPDDQLRQYGYASMNEFRNWPFFKKYGGGPFAEFASHQIDVANWYLEVLPKSVVATGGVDFYKDHQWYDNVMAVLEYPAAAGTVRALFQVLTTTSAGGGNSEHFMGTEGSIRVSENPKWTRIYHEPYAPDWDRWTELSYIVKAPSPAAQAVQAAAAASSQPVDPHVIKSQETGQVVAYEIPVVVDKPPWQPHMENFFDAVRGKAKLTCPADVAFPTEVLVRKVNEAVEARKTLEVKSEDYAV